MTKLSRLTPVEPRSVWANEAQDFTPWLHRNAEHLAEALGIDLELERTEHQVGSFSLDIIGRDNTYDCVLIVENQLTRSDHDHLGKLLTYTAGTSARTVVWIATEFKDEHRLALDHLNEITQGDTRFFGVVVSVLQIDDSAPAPLFRVVASPNGWQAEVKREVIRREASGKGLAYLEYWTDYLSRFHAEHPNLTNVRTPSRDNWMNVNYRYAGKIHYCLVFGKNDQIRAEVFLSHTDASKNLEVYEALQADRQAIESEYGCQLIWNDLPGKKACRIHAEGTGNVLDTENWEPMLEWMIDHHLRLQRVFDDRIKSITEPEA